MGKDPKAGGFKSPEKEPPLPSRGSPLLNTDVKVLTTIVNLDHKQPNEWEQLVLPSPETQVTYEDNLLKHQAMQKNSKRNNSSRVSDIELNSVDAEKEKKDSQNNFFELLPLELSLQVFSQLDMRSLCRASMTCKSWNYTIIDNDSLWEPHCLAVRAVCKREIDDDLKSGYSWRDTLLRNYQKSKVKLEWLSGRYSNICSPISLPENIMYPMDAETWGEILEAELKRYVEKSQADLITLRV